MMKTKVSMKERIDNTSVVINSFKNINSMDVLVGIPEETTNRDDGDVNNATLLLIHTNGSPLQNIPPRPLLEPALEANGNKERVEEDLKRVVDLILEGKKDQAIRAMHITGMDGVNIIKSWFTDSRNNWPPDSIATVRAKFKKKYKSEKTRSKKMNEYLQGFAGLNQVLVDTGELRNAITYVLDIQE